MISDTDGSVNPSADRDATVLVDNGLEILSPDECRDLLRRGEVGRVAVTIAALPAVFPVNYALLGDEIVFLTGEGTKLRAAVAEAVVAFEVDDFDATRPYGWSVLAVGVAQEITDPEQLSAARNLGLHPFAAGDRTHFVKIRPEFISGRRIFQ
ncbi:MAG TPA: pyridoxamine 5'-phosphate oxidase family protein [Acidimicrobiia bacterium]|jgi:nitroimidazol reductase NimA-like FMN-containing flavoprotein (pyridoxamine 5'-phosphate oxidase superfamily)|nr:pyridoxamine 5'-phosphate oxidase family protein [Acidimicrobiia bacterium]